MAKSTHDDKPAEQEPTAAETAPQPPEQEPEPPEQTPEPAQGQPGVYVAREPLFLGRFRAFNPGDVVPAGHVEKYGWAGKVETREKG